MNCSAEKASRKWADDAFRCGGTAMVTAAVALLWLGMQAGPAEAARRPVSFPWDDLFGGGRPRPRAIARRAAVPLPKPRPPEAPAAEPQQPAAGQQPPAAPAEAARPAVEAPRPAVEAPRPAAEAPKPAESAAPAAPQLSACRQALTEEIAIAPSIPDIHGPGGCGGEDLVRLEAIVLPGRQKVAVKPAAILRCKMATAIADWVRTDIAPLAQSLGGGISTLDNFDSFECRGRNRVTGAPLSEHGRANALDVRAIGLANGKSISLTDRNVPRDLRETVLHSVCARFSTVLGPGSDWYHEDHIHLDLMERRNNYRICQWNVYDPLPQVAPLLPAERPEEAPPREVADKSDAAKPNEGKPDAAKVEEPAPDAATQTTPPPTKKRRQSRRL
ncbi:extensin family protein [Bradyrhizobium genosp. P]|uniref:extensin family protein n=1 Tax=Bradyrhizobium genosp. P TaxID=83641 RepID=UPI003CF27F7D